MLSRKFFLSTLLPLALLSRAENPKSAMTCSSCHTQQASTQPATSMGRAMLLPGHNTILQRHPTLKVQKGAFTYTVETHGDVSTYAVSDGGASLSAPIHWAFGANSQTWVLERNGRFYESLVSFYPAIDGLDTTMGDQDLKPASLEEAFGRALAPGEYNACFGCHSTHAVREDTLHLESLHPGITCEHCHANAEEHRAAISRGQLNPLPPKLKQLTSEQISNFCGQCHRSWETVVRDRLFGQINVRFQPYRLANSKCFNGDDARISCIACHDPHQEVVTNINSYDKKCIACHSTGAHASAKLCPVAKSACASCHMPKVELPGAHRTFTDHYIRVVHAADPYPQ